MNIKFITLGLGGLLTLASFAARPAMADEWNKKIEFQFSGPVEIPGHVLPAGKYVFQLADPDNPTVVEIFSEDPAGKETFVTTALTIPESLEQTSDKPVVHFEERASGAPEAIQSWYYPGEDTGWGFVYPNE